MSKITRATLKKFIKDNKENTFVFCENGLSKIKNKYAYGHEENKDPSFLEAKKTDLFLRESLSVSYLEDGDHYSYFDNGEYACINFYSLSFTILKLRDKNGE